MAKDPRPRLFVCTGSDCRKRSKALSKLVDAAGPHARVVEVRCQKICDGPVCGLKVDDALHWFEEVEGKKARKAVVAVLRRSGTTEEALPKALRKRLVDKRTGKLRE